MSIEHNPTPVQYYSELLITLSVSVLQLDNDFRLQYPDAVTNVIKGTGDLRISPKKDLVQLLRVYDSKEHYTVLTGSQ